MSNDALVRFELRATLHGVGNRIQRLSWLYNDDATMLTQRALRPIASAASWPAQRWLRCFSQGTVLPSKVLMPPRPEVNEADLEEAFLKGSGPGGQKIVSRPSRLSSTLS